jgi:predicted nucleotidyltransferase
MTKAILNLYSAIALITMNINLKPILTRLKKELADLYGDRLQHLTLFGSQARGDAELGSDIDVLVVLKTPVNPGEEIKRTGKAIADLSLEYDVVVSCLFMDETHYQTRNGSLLRNIRKEGVLL